MELLYQVLETKVEYTSVGRHVIIDTTGNQKANRNDTETKGRVQMTSTAVRTTVTEVTVTTTVRHLNKSVDAIVKAYAKTKEDMKVLEAQKKALEEQIRNLMDGASVGYINGVKRVEILNRSLTKIDRKQLQEVYPEAYAATLKTTEYTVVDAE